MANADSRRCELCIGSRTKFMVLLFARTNECYVFFLLCLLLEFVKKINEEIMREREEEIKNIHKGMHTVNEIYKVWLHNMLV